MEEWCLVGEGLDRAGELAVALAKCQRHQSTKGAEVVKDGARPLERKLSLRTMKQSCRG